MEKLVQSDAFAIAAVALFIVLLLATRLARRRAKAPSVEDAAAAGLDAPLLEWTPHDAFTKRDLLRSICVQGASGSGKTNFIGYQIAKALVSDGGIGGLILASKPVEDVQFWQGIFEAAGRPKDLLVFGPGRGLRFNVLGEELKSGGDSRELASFLMTLGETLHRGEAGAQHSEQFFQQQSARMLQLAIEPVRLGTGKLSPVDVQRFITGAAMTPEQLATPGWQAGFHNRVLEAAYNAPKTPIEAADFEQVLAYWLGEIPSLNDRTRSSITTQVQGVLHVSPRPAVRWRPSRSWLGRSASPCSICPAARTTP